MVDVVKSGRSDQDSAEFRGFPTQPTTKTAAPAADTNTSKVGEFVAGATQMADADPDALQSPVGHFENCPACLQGQQEHWSHAEARSAPGMDQVVASQLIQGPYST
jgi:hypothetical protein